MTGLNWGRFGKSLNTDLGILAAIILAVVVASCAGGVGIGWFTWGAKP